MKKPKISLEITQEQHDQLSGECTARDISLSDLVRERLFETKPAAPVAVAPAKPIAVTAHRHPCLHLDPAIPQNYSATDCKGSCRVQSGRPCFWGPAQAQGCDKFRSFLVRHR